MRAYQAYRDLDARDLAERLLHEADEAFERLKLLAHAYPTLGVYACARLDFQVSFG